MARRRTSGKSLAGPTEIVIPYKTFTIRYDEPVNRWHAYQEDSKGDETRVMSAESLESLRKRIDRYEQARTGFTRVPVVTFHGYSDDGGSVRRGEITSLLPSDGWRLKQGAWVVWSDRQREKVYDASSLILGSAKNEPLLQQIGKLDGEIRKLRRARQTLVDKLEMYRPPREEEPK